MGRGWSAHTLCRGSLWSQELPSDLSGRKEGGLLAQGKDTSVPGSILARVSSSEASPMPGDPHDVSLAGGGPAAFQPREDLWLEGLGQAEVPCEALRWTQTGSHHPQPGPAALQRSP